MTTKQKRRAGYALAALVSLIITAYVLTGQATQITYVAEASVAPLNKLSEELQHRRETWVSALEWCESNGRYEAINENDLDGTPSYGAYQFKPGTFSHYVNKYGLEVKRKRSDLYTFMNYEAQRAIVLRMIDDPDVRWKNEFPWCVKKLGLPPVK